MSESTTGSAATRLCTACGLCCNGVMFHTVRLQPGDSAPALAALGLKLKRKNRQDYILQPCPAHRGGQCSIYQQRPQRCRLFECQQLKRIAEGQSSEASALEKIRDVQRRVARLERLALRSDGTPRKGPLSKRCETALMEPFDVTAHPELLAQRQELAEAMDALDQILDQDFRLPLATPLPALNP